MQNINTKSENHKLLSNCLTPNKPQEVGDITRRHESWLMRHNSDKHESRALHHSLTGHPVAAVGREAAKVDKIHANFTVTLCVST